MYLKRVLTLAGTPLLLAGCGGSGPKPVPPRRWLAPGPTRHSVVLTLRADGDGMSLGDFNGYSRGQVLVVVPRDWRVIVRCTNAAATTRHSCAIAANSLATTPAFPGAATPNPTAGLAPGSSATFSFLATRPGVYRIASLVDDDEIGAGMWDTLQVGGARLPSARLYLRIR